MIVEQAVIVVRADRQAQFEAAFPRGKKVLEASPGCRGARLHHGIEDPGRYLLLVEWDQLDDHLVGFRQSPRFGEWRSIVGEFFEGQPEVVHFERVVVADDSSE